MYKISIMFSINPSLFPPFEVSFIERQRYNKLYKFHSLYSSYILRSGLFLFSLFLGPLQFPMFYVKAVFKHVLLSTTKNKNKNKNMYISFKGVATRPRLKIDVHITYITVISTYYLIFIIQYKLFIHRYIWAPMYVYEPLGP